MGFFRFVDQEPAANDKPARPKRQKREKQKNDPKYVAAARELRDRWMERIHADPSLLTSSNGKYDVVKALPDPTAAKTPPPLSLPAQAA